MDGDKRPCNRTTCTKPKCSHLNKTTDRSTHMPPNRPGAEAEKCPSPVYGNSTQVLYVEPNFTETPSEYDIFYDCYSDIEINEQNDTMIKSINGGPSVGSSTHTKGSNMFRDALKQVIINAQTLLVEFDSSCSSGRNNGRRERKGCGSRCRCDVRNIKPQTRIVQLEVTAKVAGTNNKSSPSSSIRIDPIKFTIPLKLHLQGGHNQQSLAGTPSQQSHDARKPLAVHERELAAAGMLSSLEPIRTAIITAPRQEVRGMPMQRPATPFDLHAALLQQMTGIPTGFLPFPLLGGGNFLLPVPPPIQTQMESSKVQIQAPPPSPLVTLGPRVEAKITKSQKGYEEVCVIDDLPTPSVDPLVTPSLAPINKGPFLATIAKSSMPSVCPTKIHSISKTGSQGVCMLCGRVGEILKVEPAAQADKGVCTMCLRGKDATPKPPQLPSTHQKSGVCGSSGKGKQLKEEEDDADAAASIVVIAPPMPPTGIQRIKGPCGKCTSGLKNGGTAPPPLEELISQTKGPCGKCSKQEQSQEISPTPSMHQCATNVGPQAEQQSKGQESQSRCKICFRKMETTIELKNGVCATCSGKTMDMPMDDARAPCGTDSKPVLVTQMDIHNKSDWPCSTPKEGRKEPCMICSNGATPSAVAVEKGPCGVCSTRTATTVTVEKGPYGVCSRVTAQPKVEKSLCEDVVPVVEKGPCGVCTRRAAAPVAVVKGPCGVCTRTVAPPAAVEKGPCGVCSKGAAQPPLVTKEGCRGTGPSIEKTSCGAGAPPLGPRSHEMQGRDISKIRSSPSAPSVMSFHKKRCDICSRAPSTPKPQTDTKLPCHICKKEPAVPDVTTNHCNICKKLRDPAHLTKEEPPARQEQCDICSKLTAPSSTQRTNQLAPCVLCGSVGAPCGICTHQQRQQQDICGSCGKPTRPKPIETKPASCMDNSQPQIQSSTYESCLTRPTPQQSQVIDNTCGPCLILKPKEICSCFPAIKEIEPKFFKALPQHKDIHICSPCRYDPSPLIDADGKVFCPHNCGCCLCPWRKRATDSQIEQIKHEKIKVCKCRIKGSIFIDYTSRAKCSNTSYFDICPCRERAEAKYLEMFGEEMWSSDDRLRERVRGEAVRLEDVVEYKRASVT